MTLLDQIAKDMQVALKAGEKLRLETLRTIRAALLEKQVEKRPAGGMKEEDELVVLISASKKRKESLEVFSQHGRQDLADQEAKELEIIQSYLPKQLSQQEILQVIEGVIRELGASGPADFGRVMPPVMKELKGRADGKFVQESVRRLLGA